MVLNFNCLIEYEGFVKVAGTYKVNVVMSQKPCKIQTVFTVLLQNTNRKSYMALSNSGNSDDHE